jgi:TatD DNase family protein
VSGPAGAAPEVPDGTPTGDGETIRYVDNHCHLDETTAAEVVAEARAAGVERLVTVGTDLSHSERMIAIAREHAGVWATAGVHPHDAKDGIEGLRALVDAGASDGVVVAIGECGLDYHYDHSPRPVQRDVFAVQIRMAHECELPLVIHSREAWDDTFAILDAEGVPSRTVFHCFTGGPVEAEAALARGCLLSFSGIVTFPSATDLQDAARACPLDRLMVETDAPYLAPVPHRGKRNRPAWVVAVAEAVAELQDRSLNEVARATWSTAETFYSLA